MRKNTKNKLPCSQMTPRLLQREPQLKEVEKIATETNVRTGEKKQTNRSTESGDDPREIFEPRVPPIRCQNHSKMVGVHQTQNRQTRSGCGSSNIGCKQSLEKNGSASSRGFPWLLVILKGSFGRRCLRVCSMALKQDRSTKSACRNSIPSLTKFSGAARPHARMKCTTIKRICTTFCSRWV